MSTKPHADARSDPRWDAAIPVLLSGGVSAAARAAAVDESTLYRWRQDPAFRERLEAFRGRVQEEARDEVLGMLRDAVTRIRELLRSENEQVALAAAKTVLAQLAKAEPQVIEVHAAQRNDIDPHEANERLRLVSGGKGA